MQGGVSKKIAKQAQQVADTLLRDLDGVRAVVVATADGFDIAHAANGGVEPARLAAMLSSFAAVGDAASRETGIGTPRCLVVESSEGRLVVRCIEILGQSLVVVILTNLTVLLGMVWNSLAAAEHELVAA